MAPEQRTEPISLRLSKDEVQMLKGLVAITGLSQSDVLRQALRKLWAAETGKAPPKPKR